ncbi:MAG: ABC transporter permease subunit [Pusillimonas sp.]
MGFGFLSEAARFPVSESLLAYTPVDSYGWAVLVGLINTLYISFLVISVSTALGFLLALARRSRHPLVSALATVYVETMRNTPLVLQLLFWYSVLTLNLPATRQAYEPVSGVFLSIRGIFFPSVSLGGDTALFWACVAIALLMVLAGPALGRRIVRWLSGAGVEPNFPWRRAAWCLAVIIVLAGGVVGGIQMHVEKPGLQGFNFVGGSVFTPEFTSLLIGLTLYSAAFSGEIIRGGIDAVDEGQWEAAQSLGLRRWPTLIQIVVPQAMRVIVPPMTSQFLSIIKNTTLALAVGYPDLSFVIATTINQTGQAVEGIAILMAVYLSISLGISLFMNIYNRRITRTQRP